MTNNDSFWDFYWEIRLQEMEDLGKRAAILAASKLIRRLVTETQGPIRLLELGCGEAQIIGALVEGHPQDCPAHTAVGVDYNPRSLETCRSDYPGIRFIQGDFTDAELLNGLGQFEIVLLVNALHEVFSDAYSEDLGETDVPTAKKNVADAFAGAVRCLVPGGHVLLFDGLETPGDLQDRVQIRFLHPEAAQRFETFALEYRPFLIDFRELEESGTVELSQRDFTRFITKSIFLGKHLWPSERFESYQYYNQSEFLALFEQHNLTVHKLRTLTMNEGKWRNQVEILTPGVSFPEEHILILAQKEVSGLVS
jgi:hypothetical protein